MSTNIKTITLDENGNAFAESFKNPGIGSLFVAEGDDLVLQEDLSTGVGILTVDLATTNSTGTLTINLPDAVGNRTDKHLELDANNDITLKS